RNVAAALMIAAGVVLLVPRFQERLALAGAPLANWSDHYLGATRQSGLGGQIAVGLLLGAVWSPCVGPTLGAASILAAQGRNLTRDPAAMASTPCCRGSRRKGGFCTCAGGSRRVGAQRSR